LLFILSFPVDVSNFVYELAKSLSVLCFPFLCEHVIWQEKFIFLFGLEFVFMLPCSLCSISMHSYCLFDKQLMNYRQPSNCSCKAEEKLVFDSSQVSLTPCIATRNFYLLLCQFLPTPIVVLHYVLCCILSLPKCFPDVNPFHMAKYQENL